MGQEKLLVETVTTWLIVFRCWTHERETTKIVSNLSPVVIKKYVDFHININVQLLSGYLIEQFFQVQKNFSLAMVKFMTGRRDECKKDKKRKDFYLFKRCSMELYQTIIYEEKFGVHTRVRHQYNWEGPFSYN